jgi:hypothetical protein
MPILAKKSESFPAGPGLYKRVRAGNRRGSRGIPITVKGTSNCQGFGIG